MSNRMRFATDLSKGILGSPEPEELWEEILSHIPDEVLLSPDVRILNVACGHAVEACVLARRMIALGITKDQVNERIYLLDKYHVFTNPAKKVYGFKNVVTADFLQWETNMKFDVVIGNPPYSKGTWVKFVKKMIDKSKKYVIAIHPDGVGNFSARSEKIEAMLVNNGIQSYNECTSRFPGVESGKICVSVLNKKLPGIASCFENNSLEGRITKKIMTHDGIKIESRLSSNRSKEYTALQRHDMPGEGLVAVVESVKKSGLEIKYVDKEKTTVVDADKYWFTNRYFGKDAESPVYEYTGKVGIGVNILAIEKIDGMTLDQFKKLALTKPKRLALDVLRAGGFDTSPRHLRQISLVEDSDFNLTQEEIDYIEQTVK